MSLLNDDNAKITSMITEGKIQAVEADLEEKKVERDFFLNKPTKEKKVEKDFFLNKPTRNKKAEGGSLLADDMPMNDMPMDEPMMEQPVMDKPVMDSPMMEEPEETMLPDEEMENEFIDFILDEALSEEEEDMLMSILEQDDQLSMLFDKVIDVAQEFAGSGPVEGPGSGVSDSIPARLSDGEFVFTAAAVKTNSPSDNLAGIESETPEPGPSTGPDPANS